MDVDASMNWADGHSWLFTVRVWTEVVADGVEHRGRVRDVTSGAHRAFRDWTDLTAFLMERVDMTKGVF